MNNSEVEILKSLVLQELEQFSLYLLIILWLYVCHFCNLEEET